MIDDLKRILEDFPGESELVLEVHTSAGPRRAASSARATASPRNPSLKAELDRLLAPARPLARAA